MSVFNDLYSKYYDLLYLKKDYEGECNYIFEFLKKAGAQNESILELGCGTGRHAFIFGEHFKKYHGIDISNSMINRAKERNQEKKHLSFSLADVRTFNSNEKFNVVVSLFHVASYQKTNQDLEHFFKVAFNSLDDNGVFIFDFWYGPGVLTDHPKEKKIELEDEFIVLERKTTPIVQYSYNQVDVVFDIKVKNKKNNDVFETQEIHGMRFLFLPELESFLHRVGFTQISSYPWLTTDKLIGNPWYGVIVAKK